MSAQPQPSGTDPSGSDYEDLLGQWSDLESALSALLARPRQARDFVAKVRQCDRWLQDLVAHDIDAALYLMFQLAATSTVGYSASHALVCGTLCHILAQELQLPPQERDSLVRAAFTMNIGMTALQDALAVQREPLSAEQQQVVASHPRLGLDMLEDLQVTNDLWLEIVATHHVPSSDAAVPLASLPVRERLTRILSTIDRYAALISPRKSRAGRSATDSVRAIVGQDSDVRDEASLMLVRTVGLCPPGTFVRLDNGETAVVLRRSERANFPLVASVLDAKGEPLASPALYHTVRGQPRIQSALARSAVTVELHNRTMVRLGLYAAQRTQTLSR
ncbi:MAG: HD domain-containing phosphohydrolase [Diaphorobacter nitroreducens]|uniref:HD-GYP domain-containing protein n=1 Tax=Diaphorobacter nitroreducens TaxID=164759 RepID=UPI003C71F7FB